MSESPQTLNVNEQHRLLDALRAKDAPHKSFRGGTRNYLIGCLMLEAGLRVGEVVALRLSDLFFNCKPVLNLVLRSEITKNHKERSVPVSTRLKEALEEYFRNVFTLDDTLDECFAIFTLSPDHPLTTRQVERIIRSAAMESIGRPVHPHVLRHTFASRLMRVTDMRTVQELLGHSNIASTQIYTHPNEDDKKKAIDGIADDLSP
ncbi:MAG: tyrosine-type recombinase/integrase [Sedimentisphaerales bacterium]